MLCADKYSTWTWNGAIALCQYLEDWEMGMGEEMEFDVTSIRCTWHEYSSIEEAAVDHIGSDWRTYLDIEEDADDDDIAERITQHLRTIRDIITFDGGIIIAQ